jgi:hypothetical protein
MRHYNRYVVIVAFCWILLFVASRGVNGSEELITKLETNGDAPSRYLHSAILLGKEEMAIIGGTDDDTGKYHRMFETISILNLDTNKWRRESTTKGSSPLPRIQPSVVKATKSNKVLMYGGSKYTSQTPQQTAELWTLDLKNFEWERIGDFIPTLENDNFPGRRSGHTAVFSDTNNTMYIYGGQSSNYIWGKIHSYNLDAKTWEKIEIKEGEIKPPARTNHCAFLYEDDMIVFGGEGQLVLNQYKIWVFSTKTKKWKVQVTKAKYPTIFPTSFSSSCSATLNKQQKHSVIITLSTKQQPGRNSMWSLNLKTWQWSRYDDINMPEVENFSIIQSENNMFFFGGQACSATSVAKK